METNPSAATEGATAGATAGIHGPRHWRRVASIGHALLEETPRTDPVLVFLFALFHDSMRINDHRDPEHGTRAAVLARELCGELHFVPDPEMELLGYALAEHDNGLTSDESTVGTCWDADRLNLWRVGIRPDPALLSTAAASRPERIQWAREAMRLPPPGWEDLAADSGLSWGRS